jgi:hypothetical protein
MKKKINFNLIKVGYFGNLNISRSSKRYLDLLHQFKLDAKIKNLELFIKRIRGNKCKSSIPKGIQA